MKSKVVFGNEELKEAFDNLRISKTEDKNLYRWLIKAFNDLENNAFCGIQIPKKLFPKDYIKKFGKIDNLWKYNLPKSWRLIYTIKKEEIVVLSIILEWLDHKKYEKRFRY